MLISEDGGFYYKSNIVYAMKISLEVNKNQILAPFWLGIAGAWKRFTVVKVWLKVDGVRLHFNRRKVLQMMKNDFQWQLIVNFNENFSQNVDTRKWEIFALTSIRSLWERVSFTVRKKKYLPTICFRVWLKVYIGSLVFDLLLFIWGKWKCICTLRKYKHSCKYLNSFACMNFEIPQKFMFNLNYRSVKLFFFILSFFSCEKKC